VKKRAFTLLEILISLSLLTILLGTLFYAYFQLSKPEQAADSALMWHMEEEKFVQKRLTRLFETTQLLFSTDNRLVFTFENPPCKEPELSGRVIGTLFLDASSHTLALAVWPSIGQSPNYITPLLENVSSLSYSFYFPSNHALQVDPDKVGVAFPKSGWQSTWEKAYGTLPVMLKLDVRYLNSEESTVFVFDLPSTLMVSY
jgi:prepilin-type N-terminal cleavage/methylation domain-containing protein